MEALNTRQREINDFREQREWRARREREERLNEEKQQQEKRLLEHTHAKLPKLSITPFQATASDWVRFENILLELVSPKVRERISNLKPSSVG